MLKAVMQYPRKDMLAPNSSTVKTNPNVCAAQKIVIAKLLECHQPWICHV